MRPYKGGNKKTTIKKYIMRTAWWKEKKEMGESAHV